MRLLSSRTAASQGEPIPAYLSFDVEPDGFQLSRTAPPHWTGYDMACSFAERLRTGIESLTGIVPRFGWYFRTDPQVAEVYGRPDYILAKHPDRIDGFLAHGDYLGVHAHALRWCGRRNTWIHDFADAAWVAESTKIALESFAGWCGSPTERFRSGGGFLSNTIIEVLDDYGVKVDLTLEPVAGWGLTAATVPTAVDDTPFIGQYTNCAGSPRVAYRPARHDFRIPAGRKDGRKLTIIPLTTYVPDVGPQADVPRWRRVAKSLRKRFCPVPQVLYPSLPWPDPKTFWDLAERELESMRNPYLSLAVRTNAADSKAMAAEWQILEALHEHPLGKRLHFTDPLESLSSLLN
jgi:hypothetical protein